MGSMSVGMLVSRTSRLRNVFISSWFVCKRNQLKGESLLAASGYRLKIKRNAIPVYSTVVRPYSPTPYVTCIKLYGTQAKTGADPKHGTTDREDVDDVAHPSVDLVSNEWVKAGADGHGKALPVAHESQE